MNRPYIVIVICNTPNPGGAFSSKITTKYNCNNYPISYTQQQQLQLQQQKQQQLQPQTTTTITTTTSYGRHVVSNQSHSVPVGSIYTSNRSIIANVCLFFVFASTKHHLSAILHHLFGHSSPFLAHSSPFLDHSSPFWRAAIVHKSMASTRSSNDFIDYKSPIITHYRSHHA